MEFLHNGYTLEIPEGSFPLSTDTMTLAGFVKLPRNAQVLDLCSGCGSIGLLLCADRPDCHVTGIELDPHAHAAALRNIAANGLEDRMSSICADINNISELIPAGKFPYCVSNPPYFSSGPQSQNLPLARRDDGCSMDALLRAAAWGLKFGGDFFVVHRPERLAELCCCASAHKLEPKRLCLLRHKEGGPVSLILLQCRKGGKPGLLWEEAALFTPQGTPTDYYHSIYHTQGG